MSSPAERYLSADLPARRPPAADSLSIVPAGLKLWIDALPMANPGVAARMLYNGLKEHNGYQIEPSQRIKLLDLLRVPVRQVCQTLDKQVMNMPFPLPPQKRQFGEVSRDFHHLLAQGYRLAALDICLGRTSVPFMKGGLVIHALVRAIVHLRDALMKCYFSYAAVPEGYWRQLHGVALFAREMGLLDKGGDDDHALLRAKHSIEGFYLQPVLLSLCNPYRFSQKEIADLGIAFENWAAEASLAFDAEALKAHEFPLSPDSDLEPGRVDQQSESAFGVRWRVVSGKLFQALNRELDRIPAGQSAVSLRARRTETVDLSIELIGQVRNALGVSAERGFSRLPARHQLETVIGLDAVHYMTAGRLDFSSFLEMSRQGSQIDIAQAPNWTGLAADQFRPLVINARVLDQSLGGYRVLWPKSESLRAKIGELIGLSTGGDDDEQVWMVGITRWLRVHADSQIEVGVELLSRRVRALSVRGAAGGKLANPQRGLLLWPLKPTEGERSLVLPGFITGAAEVLTIGQLTDPTALNPNLEFDQIQIANVVETTGHFSQFRFQPYEGEPSVDFSVADASTRRVAEPSWNLL